MRGLKLENRVFAAPVSRLTWYTTSRHAGTVAGAKETPMVALAFGIDLICT